MHLWGIGLLPVLGNVSNAHRGCAARTRSGRPCSMPTIRGKRYCYAHSPDHAAQRAATHRAGGLARHTPHATDAGELPREARTLDDARAILTYTLRELGAHDNSLARVRVLLALHDAILRTWEVGELEARIAALEARP